MCNDCWAVVHVPGLMATYCQTVKGIKPFDTFVAVGGVHIPGTEQASFHELVVKTVDIDGSVSANLYRVQDGGRKFEQMAQFRPPYTLKQQVHMGLFIPQAFFFQFIDQVPFDGPTN